MANNNHFELTLDTLAPTGSVTLSGKTEIYENKALTIEKGDAIYMKLWFDTKASGDAADAESVDWIAADTSYTTQFTTSGRYYYHMILMDDVGNQSDVYNTAIIVYDTEIPVITNVELPTITATKDDIAYAVTFEDPSPSSGVTTLKVKYTWTDSEGEHEKTLTDIDNPTSGTEYHFSFDSTCEDATYTVVFQVVDAAGNESVAVSKNIVLNTKEGELILVLEDSAESALPDYINYHEIKVNLTCANDPTITGYKIWEDGATEPADYTSWTEGTDLDVTVDFTLSANDGKKTIHAKAINTASTVVEAEDKSVTIDSVNPTIDTFTLSKSIISTVSGYDTSVMTIKVSDDVAGVKNWKVVLGTAETDTNITDGTDLETTFDLTKASGNMGDDGTYSVTIFVYDNAGNSSSKTLQIILDTTAPTISLNTLTGTSADTAGWYNDLIANAVATYTDANKISKLYVWISRTAGDTTPTSEVIETIPTSPYNIPTSVINETWINASQGTGNYLHAQVIDEVGNVGTAHAEFKLDTVAPDSLTANFDKSVYTSSDVASVTINAADATSGTAWMRVTGNIANPTASDSWEEYASSRVISFLAAGDCAVTVQVKDAAGNVRTETASTTCEYDPVAPYATLVLRNSEDTDTKESPTSVAGFVARVSGTDDGEDPETGGIASYYQLYGDYSVGEQKAAGVSYVDDDAHWIALSYDAGQQYKTVSDLYLTTGDGEKNIYLRVKDNAGNISEEVKLVIELDTTAPIVVVSDIDYQRISKIHSYRLSGTIATTKYCDEMHFVFTPDSVIQAYKVCAYTDVDAALAGNPEADEPIPQTGDVLEALTPASINTHQTGLSAATAVDVTITGADYEYALGGVSTTHELDGAHIVVVYVQDLAGTWSENAIFSA